MCPKISEKSRLKRKKGGNTSNSIYDADWHDTLWLDSVSKERYGPEEKSTVKKVMIPVTTIVKLWKRIFK